MGLRSDEFLVELLGDADPDYDAVRFAVTNLGFLLISRFGSSLVETMLHPRNVHPRAVLAAVPVIAASSAVLFSIRYLQQHWRREVVPSASDAALRVFALSGIGDPDRPARPD